MRTELFDIKKSLPNAKSLVKRITCVKVYSRRRKLSGNKRDKGRAA